MPLSLSRRVARSRMDWWAARFRGVCHAAPGAAWKKIRCPHFLCRRVSLNRRGRRGSAIRLRRPRRPSRVPVRRNISTCRFGRQFGCVPWVPCDIPRRRSGAQRCFVRTVSMEDNRLHREFTSPRSHSVPMTERRVALPIRVTGPMKKASPRGQSVVRNILVWDWRSELFYHNHDAPVGSTLRSEQGRSPGADRVCVNQATHLEFSIGDGIGPAEAQCGDEAVVQLITAVLEPASSRARDGQ